MLGLTGGELFLVAFLTLMLATARFWPRVGAAIGRRVAGAQDDAKSSPRPGRANADD